MEELVEDVAYVFYVGLEDCDSFRVAGAEFEHFCYFFVFAFLKVLTALGDTLNQRHESSTFNEIHAEFIIHISVFETLHD